MIAISLTFLAGRYHATPWGRHVNEGAVEWPPSPWRLLRSLVAVWKRTLPDDVHEVDIKPILEKLAATPPRFVLPPASTGHTRHYMPWYKDWTPPGQYKKTLVFDAFVALDPDHSAVFAIWPDDPLSTAQRELLQQLLTNLNFLGRAESWCEARLLSDDDAAALEAGDVMRAEPLDDTSDPAARRDVDLVRTLCPDPATAFEDTHVVEIKITSQGRGKSKTTTESRQPVYDPNWHLCMETLRLHDQKWSDPPGSRWVTYTRPRDCFEIKPAPLKTHTSRRPAASDNGPMHIARYALDSSVLPLITDTLPVAEAARRALIRILIDLRGRDVYGAAWSRDLHKAGVQPVPRDAAITGKDAEGRPCTGHRHAYFLPTDEDADGRLDHLTVYASGGFGPDELRALERLQRITWHSPHPLRAVLLLTSSLTHATAERTDPLDPHSHSPLARSPVACSAVWTSATPYLVTRHPKTRGPDKVDLTDIDARERFFHDDLVAQLRSARRDLAELIPLTDKYRRFIVPSGPNGSRHLYPLQFKRFRSKDADDGGRRPSGAFRIVFPQSIRGPLALGHSSHFGMGLFLPARSDSPDRHHAPQFSSSLIPCPELPQR